MIRLSIFVLLGLVALGSAACAQTQDWTGVPNPGSDPQMQQLYAKALADATQQYNASQQYAPPLPGVPQQYTQWVKQATILFDANCIASPRSRERLTPRLQLNLKRKERRATGRTSALPTGSRFRQRVF